MVVYDLNLIRFALNPGEANAVPIIDANAALAFPVTFESLQLVAGWYSQLFQGIDGIELVELSYRHAP